MNNTLTNNGITILNSSMQSSKGLGFKKLETVEIINGLRRTLASYQIFFHKLQSFHWNVVGSDFYDIHDITESMYKEALENIDDIAERIRVFGKFPEVRLSQYLKESIIKESSHDKSSEFMILDLIMDIQKLTENLLDLYESSASHGDIATIHMCSRIVKELENYHWQLSSWSNRKYAK